MPSATATTRPLIVWSRLMSVSSLRKRDSRRSTRRSSNSGLLRTRIGSNLMPSGLLVRRIRLNRSISSSITSISSWRQQLTMLVRRAFSSRVMCPSVSIVKVLRLLLILNFSTSIPRQVRHLTISHSMARTGDSLLIIGILVYGLQFTVYRWIPLLVRKCLLANHL